jgi:hypothetical protein
MPFYILHFIILWLMPTLHLPLWLLAVSGSFAIAFFWEGYHWDFSHAKHKISTTKEIGKMYILSILVAACGPNLDTKKEAGTSNKNSTPYIRASRKKTSASE